MLEKLAQLYQMTDEQIEEVINNAAQVSAPPPPEVLQTLMAMEQQGQQEVQPSGAQPQSLFSNNSIGQAAPNQTSLASLLGGQNGQ